MAERMSELTLAGEPPIVVALRRTARARRLTLRVSGLDGQVTLTVPPHVPAGEASSFLRARESWLRDKLGSVAGPVRVGDDDVEIRLVEGEIVVATIPEDHITSIRIILSLP